ncbi:uncharacterized protein NPIL_130791 [Nephila pilipes]|uniref:Uncharacterized protein n=1 Tax=Nephila pilipes TaxID=299642 RepID=A0A8X6PH48_NEPPI|nr:uncharacterized protein NPIL_130791 [Nephila pilipes]
MGYVYLVLRSFRRGIRPRLEEQCDDTKETLKLITLFKMLCKAQFGNIMYASHPPPPTDISRLAKNKRLKLADPDDSLSNLPIEILIGVDFYLNVMNSEPPFKLTDSLTLIPSILGCILSGPRSQATVSFIPTVHNINVARPSLNDALETGTNLFSNIMAKLLKFRLSKIATWKFMAHERLGGEIGRNST